MKRYSVVYYNRVAYLAKYSSCFIERPGPAFFVIFILSFFLYTEPFLELFSSDLGLLFLGPFNANNAKFSYKVSKFNDLPAKFLLLL